MNKARKMKRRRVLYLVTGAALLATAFLVWPRGQEEPVYHGKKITQWIDEAFDVGIFEQTDETKAAMATFGTNAIPFLLKEFTRPISRWQGGLYSCVNGIPFFELHLRTDEERVRLAGHGLMLLETNAAPALHVLARYLDDPFRDGLVTDIFCLVGDAALPYLTAGLASTNAVAITNVLVVLQSTAHRSIAARETFAAALSHPSPAVRDAAIVYWNNVAESQDDIVPRLVTWASDPSPLVREAATNQLVRLTQRHGNPVSAAAAEALLKLQTYAPPKAAP